MISIKNLQKKFGDFEALKNITLHVGRGEVVTLIGPSGSGKSVLLRCINLLEKPSAGMLSLENVPITNKSDVQQVRKKIGMIQSKPSLFQHLSVFENLTIGPVRLLSMPVQEAGRRAMELLRYVGLMEVANAHPEQLTNGQQQRACIARCLSMNPSVILIDDPTEGLELSQKGEVSSVIKTLSRDGTTMLIATNDLGFARNVSSRIVFMNEGQIVEDGIPSDVYDYPKSEETRVFIDRMRYFHCKIQSDQFDSYQLMNNLTNYCHIHSLARTDTNKALFIAKELLELLPKQEPVDMHFRYKEKEYRYELEAFYGGVMYNIADSEESSAFTIRNNTNEITYDFNERNHIKIIW